MCLWASFIILWALPSRAQDVKAVHKDYDWGGAAVWDHAWDAPSTDTEVLRDQLSIRLKNTKPQYLAVFFERSKVIRFSSEVDILQHGRFVIPESLDPAFDEQLTPWAERNGHPSPPWFNVRLDHFAARIVRPNGTWGEIGIFSSVRKEQVRTAQTMQTAWSYSLDLQAISPGDVVEVRWKYMVPYNNYWEATQGWRAFQWMDNWANLTSWRVFFHSDLPIREQTVSLSYNLKHGLILGGGPPDEKIEDKDNVVVKWHNTNLAACIDEVNAHVEDLPFIAVRLEMEDTRHFRPDRYSGIPRKQPYWLSVIRTRENRAFQWLRMAHMHFPDRQNKLIREFVARVGGRASDNARRMELMHEEIASNFEYEDDLDWFNEVDLSLARMGDQVNEHRLRNISRYDLYAKLANAIDAPYSTAYVVDKRVGTLNDHWMTPLWANEFLFGIRDGAGVQWMHPKCGRFGTLTNELPFYWQGAPALLMDLEQLANDFPAPPLFVDLPLDDAIGNVRGIEYTVDVDGEQANGSVRVFLSGQFSTLGRGSYADLPMDASVDPQYGSVAYDREGVIPRVKGDSHLDTDPPFRFRTNAEVVLPGISVQGKDDNFSVDLSRFIAHVVPENFVAADRDLPFYWDFAQDDRVIVDLHFARPVKLLNTDEIEQAASTANAMIERSVKHISPNTIRVESRLVVHAEREEVSEATYLETLFKIAKAESLHLLLRSDSGQP